MSRSRQPQEPLTQDNPAQQGLKSIEKINNMNIQHLSRLQNLTSNILMSTILWLTSIKYILGLYERQDFNPYH